jgi:bifunctional DNA-binding transcriptional regulator/antitoxin component of YhaV-PrlF toxin-antitoxin module
VAEGVKQQARGRSRISRKNQVTLSAAVLKQARMVPGDELFVEAGGEGRIVLTRAHDPLDDFVGAVPGLAQASGEWAP